MSQYDDFFTNEWDGLQDQLMQGRILNITSLGCSWGVFYVKETGLFWAVMNSYKDTVVFTRKFKDFPRLENFLFLGIAPGMTYQYTRKFSVKFGDKAVPIHTHYAKVGRLLKDKYKDSIQYEMKALRREGIMLAKIRFHSISWRNFKPSKDNESSTAVCTACGCSVTVRLNPLPNQIDISGDAIAIECDFHLLPPGS